MLDAVIPDMNCEPLVDFDPLHASDPVQVVALVEDHVSVALPPDTIVEVLDVSVTVGVGVVGVLPDSHGKTSRCGARGVKFCSLN